MRYDLEQMLAEIARDLLDQPPKGATRMTQDQIRALRLEHRARRQAGAAEDDGGPSVPFSAPPGAPRR